MTKTDIARIAHVTINAYTFMIKPGTLLLNWDETTKEDRDSYISGVEWVMNNPATTPTHQHDAWVKYKRDTGWLYGMEIDTTLRRHPCLVPWDELSLQHRTKDTVFIAVVKSLLPMQDYLKPEKQ